MEHIQIKDEDNISYIERQDRLNFVRKVYSILAVQLSITTGFIAAVKTSDNLLFSVQNNTGLYLTSSVCAMILCCMIICCFGRSVPMNYILLFLFTLCESYAVAGITSYYETKVVCMAGAATALTTIALTIYAMKTTTKIEVFAGMAFVVYLAMLPLIIISFIIGLGALNTLYCALGIVLYGLFLIIDTIMITGGKTMSDAACSMDDYVIGAMMLYLDIIMLFIYLLRILGSNNDCCD
jgi:FtsH-binding integral membrane protein